LDLGLVFSSSGNPILEAFLHFPLNDDIITPDGFLSPHCTGFCDANWGPQDASVPKTDAPSRSVSIHETKLVCGHVLFMGVLLLNGLHIKKNIIAVVPARQKSRLLMNVSRVFNNFDIY